MPSRTTPRHTRPLTTFPVLVDGAPVRAVLFEAPVVIPPRPFRLPLVVLDVVGETVSEAA